MKKNALLILAGMLLIFSSSCYYDSLPPEEVNEIPQEQVISFEADVLPILEKYDCAQCHDGGLDPDLRAQNAYNALVPDYVVAGDAGASVFFQRLPGNDHPPAGISLTGDEINIIQEWINRGALE